MNICYLMKIYQLMVNIRDERGEQENPIFFQLNTGIQLNTVYIDSVKLFFMHVFLSKMYKKMHTLIFPVNPFHNLEHRV